MAKVEGKVLDAGGHPIPGAKVFLEAGLEGALLTTQTDNDGAYAFEGVVPDFVGVFAYAPGYAVNGRSENLTIDATVSLDIALTQTGTLAGVVQDENGKPIPGARVTRVVILEDSKVGIPFSKLAAHGLPEPVTDAAGRFVIAVLPEGAQVAPKVIHPQYAQEAPTLRVGQKDARVVLTRGVLVTGMVVARGRDAAVPNATLFFRNAQPPHDTVITRSQNDGSYAVRLKPGPWLYEASGAAFRTPNLQRVMINGDYPNQRIALQVAGTAPLRGSVMDAKSGGPVANARIVLLSSGAPVAVALTGPTGAYELNATEGETVVRLDAAPGYLLPPEPAFRVSTRAGKTTEMPTFWVAPLPRYSLEVIDIADAPVAGAIVRVLRPEQFGWYATDSDGLVELSFGSLPADGTVVGMVEHPTQPLAALFAITRERSSDAIVQLMPLTALRGTVVDEKNSGVPGALVEARTTLEGFDQPVTLWRTFSGKDGSVRWPAVVPRAPIVCFASTLPSADAPAAAGESVAIVPEPDSIADIGNIVLPAAAPGRSALGRKYAWYRGAIVCGSLPPDAARCPAVIVHTAGAQAAMIAETLAHAQRMLPPSNIVFAVVVSTDVPCGDVSVPILRGEAPSSATTLLLNADAEVVLETVGLPPVSAIQSLLSGE